LVSCNGVAGSVQVSTPSGTVCYYGVPDGALCEFRSGACRNLLSGGLTSIVLMTQPATPDPRCPAGVAAGAPCFAITPVSPDPANPPSQVDVAFAIRDDD